jgi:hypothetical protein
MKIVCVVLVLIVSVGARAQSLDDALVAYDAKDYVRAYLWKSPAADGRLSTVPQRKARTGRDAIGAVMSQVQLAQARELIEVCKASDLEECD